MMTLKCYATSGSIFFALFILFCSVYFFFSLLLNSIMVHCIISCFIVFYFMSFYFILFCFILYSIHLYSMFASVEVRVVSDLVTQTMPLRVLFFILFHSIFWTSVEA